MLVVGAPYAVPGKDTPDGEGVFAGVLLTGKLFKIGVPCTCSGLWEGRNTL